MEIQLKATDSSKLDEITKNVVDGSELVQENLPAACLSRALRKYKVSVAEVQSMAPRCESVLLYIESGATHRKGSGFLRLECVHEAALVHGVNARAQWTCGDHCGVLR